MNKSLAKMSHEVRKFKDKTRQDKTRQDKTRQDKEAITNVASRKEKIL